MKPQTLNISGHSGLGVRAMHPNSLHCDLARGQWLWARATGCDALLGGVSWASS